MDFSSLTGRSLFQNSRTTLKHHSHILGSDFNLLKKTNIHTEFRKTNYGKYSIGFKGAIIWNDLPSNIRNISSYNMFKIKSQRVCD